MIPAPDRAHTRAVPFVGTHAAFTWALPPSVPWILSTPEAVSAAAGQEKYAPSVGVTVTLLRSGSGGPLYRLERLQQRLGVPLPASTQWALMAPLRVQAQPIFDALVVLATNAPVLHHDDTTMRIFDLQRPGSATVDELAGPMPHRKATFTTNVLANVESQPIA